jgi:hypothetical protein
MYPGQGYLTAMNIVREKCPVTRPLDSAYPRASNGDYGIATTGGELHAPAEDGLAFIMGQKSSRVGRSPAHN